MTLILGMGITGLSVFNFFVSNKIKHKIADSRKSPPLIRSFAKNKYTQNYYLGSWKKECLLGVSEIVVSPGITILEDIIVWAKEQNIPIISDIELFSRYAKAPIVGITGSNGKSTVVSLLGEVAKNSDKKVAVCGNIGKPVLDCLAEDIDLYIVEISSYHLDYTKDINLHVAVVLNITPDHLDRYANFEDYIATKLSIYKYSKNKLVNLDDDLVKQVNGDYYFSLDSNNNCNFSLEVDGSLSKFFYKNIYLFSSDDLKIFGKHNIVNILAVLSLADILSFSLTNMVKAVLDFKGLEHRLEWVGKIDNIDFFNDSKSTNAISTITAIRSLSDKYANLALIIGGIAKKEDYTAMFNLINEKVKTVILIGQSSDIFSKHISCANLYTADSMESAVRQAKIYSKNGAILLSPACASFDMYDNFSSRGKHFKEIILK